MSTPIGEWITACFSAASGNGLWLVDENMDYDASISDDSFEHELHISTNRFDRYLALSVSYKHVVFGDFDWDNVRASNVHCVVYRTSKEKATVHYNIEQAFAALPIGGELHLFGNKQDGIKTYGRKAAELFSDGNYKNKKSQGYEWFSLTKRKDIAATSLLKTPYTGLKRICGKYLSKPGVFGWKKIDAGSAFLIDALDAQGDTIHPKRSWLDLGCGFGYLSVEVQQRFDPLQLVATDNNAAALIAAQANFKAFDIQGDVLPSDAGEQIPDTYHYVIANIPFHHGFAVDFSLVNKFIRGIAAHLHRNGRAFIVVNRGVPFLRLAEGILSADCLQENGAYRVFQCGHI